MPVASTNLGPIPWSIEVIDCCNFGLLEGLSIIVWDLGSIFQKRKKTTEKIKMGLKNGGLLMESDFEKTASKSGVGGLRHNIDPKFHP